MEDYVIAFYSYTIVDVIIIALLFLMQGAVCVLLENLYQR